MNVELRPDFPVTDEACLAATGKTLGQWSELIAETPEIENKRREAISWLWNQVGRSPAQAWWGTTIWVEHERRIGRVQKDGRPEGYNICVTKSVVAPVDSVLASLIDSIPAEHIVRVREGKDVRATWQTQGIETKTEIDATVKEATGKIAINVMHKRIETREEADGLRRAWQERLDNIKRTLEN